MGSEEKKINRNHSISLVFSKMEEPGADMSFKGREEKSSIFVLDMLNMKCLCDILEEISCR